MIEKNPKFWSMTTDKLFWLYFTRNYSGQTGRNRLVVPVQDALIPHTLFSKGGNSTKFDYYPRPCNTGYYPDLRPTLISSFIIAFL